MSPHENRKQVSHSLQFLNWELEAKRQRRAELQPTIDESSALDCQIKIMEDQQKGLQSYVMAEHERIK